VRLSPDQWAEFKPKTPFGTLPVLEEDGKMMGGSVVILRYVGEKLGLAGDNAWDNAWLGNLGDFISDLIGEMIKIRFEKDETRKKELEDKFKNEGVPKYFGKLNELSESTGYLFSGRASWPDFLAYNIISDMEAKKPDFTDNFPGLKKLKGNIEGNPGVAKWLKERPDTPF
jgi:glutathione S-transferase